MSTPLPIRRGKRLFDLLLSLALLGLTAPLWAVIAVAMLLEQWRRPASRGPLFHRETRISRGRPFTILKFRTVTVASLDAGRTSGAFTVKLLEKDPRNLTGCGRWLMRSYLDELPQLLNILVGDMSFVGPRPWPPEEYAIQLAEGVDTKGIIPCGLLGLVQCMKGRQYDYAELDRQYIEAYRTRSVAGLLWFDLTIILRSLRVLFQARGL